MADKRISQLIERVDIANNDVLPIVASGATTTNKVTISTIQEWMQENLDVGVTSVGITLGSSGTDVNVTGSPITTSGNITINIPDASASARGVVTTGSQVFGGVKTFANGLSLPAVGGSNQTTRIVNIGTLHEGTASLNQIGFNSGNNIYFGKGLNNGGVISWNNASVRYYTLPDADGTIALTSQLDGYVTLNTAQTITAQKTFTTSGSSDTMIISHGSGSGIALDVIKAGNSEAIRVTKTSGSGNAVTITGGLLSAEAGTFSGDLQSTTRVIANTGGQSIILTANSGGTTNRIEGSAGLPMHIVTSGSSLAFAAGGTTPQITLASTGAVTFANKITINTPSDGIGILLNGRTSDNFSSIRFGANTGGGQYNSINVSSSSFDIISIGNTPITFGTNTTGGGGTRMTISGTGAVTLTGALNGTSASFTGDITASSNAFFGTFNGNDKYHFEPFTNAAGGANNAYFVSGKIDNNERSGFVFQARNSNGEEYNAIIVEGHNSTSTTTPFSIASTGAATFSSSVTAQVNNISADGAGVVLQGYVDNNLRIAVRGSGYNSGARGGLLASTGDFSSQVTASGAKSQFVANGGDSAGAGISLNTTLTTNPTLRRNWGIFTEDQVEGDFSIKCSTAAGGSAQTGNTRLAILSNGNVGIGTASPNAKLDVIGGISARDFRVTNSIDNTVVGYVLRQGAWVGGGSAATNLSIAAETGNGISFYVNGSSSGPPMFLNTSGNLGIGVTNPTKRLQVEASVAGEVVLVKNTRNNGNGDYALVTDLGSNANNTNNYHYIAATGGVDRLYIFGNGNVQNTNNSYGSLSDIKLKENIEDATPKLDDLMKVKVRNYNLIGDDKKQIGVIAQELEEVFPAMIDESEDFEDVEVPQLDEEGNEILNEEGEVVTTKDRVSKGTTTKSVKYSVFVPMLIKAMQEQQEQIKSLTEQVEALKSQING